MIFDLVTIAQDYMPGRYMDDAMVGHIGATLPLGTFNKNVLPHCHLMYFYC